MPKDESRSTSAPPSRAGPAFTEAARLAAIAAKAEKRASAGPFGSPELFVLGAGEHAFTWELRRFGGIVLQRASKLFKSAELARADGEVALAALRASPDSLTLKRDRNSE